MSMRLRVGRSVFQRVSALRHVATGLMVSVFLLGCSKAAVSDADTAARQIHLPLAITPTDTAPTPPTDTAPTPVVAAEPAIHEPRPERTPVVRDAGGGQRPRAVVKGKPVDASLQRTVVFQTSPSGAFVRLTGTKSGQIFEGMSPYSFTVPPDTYTWQIVELPGYLPDRARYAAVDVVTARADTVSVTLVPADVATLTSQADDKFSRGECAEAVRLYESISTPNDLAGEPGLLWLRSRLRQGQCLRKMRETDKAIQVFERLLAAAPGQWSAKYELGLAYCDVKDTKKGIDALTDLQGSFLGQLSPERQPAVRALGRYGAALCRYQDLATKDAQKYPELREQLIGELEEFVMLAGNLTKGRVPDDLRPVLIRAFDDAKRKLRDVPGS